MDIKTKATLFIALLCITLDILIKFDSLDKTKLTRIATSTVSVSAEIFPLFVKFSAMEIFYNPDTAWTLLDITRKRAR
jgi:hypothetical protein